MPQRPPAIQGLDAFRRVANDPGRSLKDRYAADPIGLAEKLGLQLPKKPVQVMIEQGIITPDEAVEKYGAASVQPGIRELVEDVCLLRERSVAAVANRGGGKSKGVSYIEFFLWMLRDFDALNLGGSELQANNVYQYLLGYIDSEPEFATLLKDEPKVSETFTVEDAWIRVLTASSKSVRSPHAGGYRKGKVRGGLLVIDEEAEAERDIVESALPTINTARPSVNVRCSTFHKATGTFADLIDSHEEMGYKLYQWDTFDVAARCPCVDVCQSPEPCFREDHVEKIFNPDTGEEEEKVIHKAYCGGRAMYADGWIEMEEIETLWKRWKRNHTRWEVEAMGSRPTSAGFVIKDLTAFARNITTASGESLYVPGYPVSICVDWGTVAAGIEVWQEQMNDNHVLIDAVQMEENNQTEMYGAIFARIRKYGYDVVEIAADMGGGGNYLNPDLRENHGLPVRDVNFQTEKEAAVAAWNILNEGDKCKYPAEFDIFTTQVRNWKRNSQGHINKGNDHLCDTAICYFSKFIERLGLSNIRVTPRSFHAGTDRYAPGTRKVVEDSYDDIPELPAARPGRRALARSIGRRR